ncbi:hypothetical protein BGZ94_005972 [Podila epigama]|nr:hypothetical protein BGZ94_005972 [Podila epigama]
MDLTTEDGLLQYLNARDETRGIAALERLSGGSANYVYRGTIPELHSDMFDERQTVIVKHSADHVATYKEMALFVDRMSFEHTVYTIVANATDHKSSSTDKEDETIETTYAKVPRVLYWDQKNNVAVLEDAGKNSTHLKGFISSLTQPPSLNLSKVIANSLGEFLARLHLYGHRHRSELYPSRMTNKEGVSLSREILYDQVPKRLNKHLQDLPQSDLDVVTLATNWGGNRLMNEPETLAHGDFWPGNMLIDTTTGEGNDISLKHLFIVDWELSRYGPAAMDVGQFMAEALSLNKYRHPCEELSTGFLEAYCKTYGDRLTTTDLKTAIIHCGGHFISWTAFTGWFKEDDDHQAKTREIMLIGVEYIKRAWAEDWSWIRQETPFRVMVDHLGL